MSLSTSGLPDVTGSVYHKIQTFGEQGFHSETPPSFSLPSDLGSTGPPAPGVAPSYAPPPFLHILPAHQQPHSLLLHQHLLQDAQSLSGQRSQPPAPCSPNREPPNLLRQLSLLDNSPPLKRGGLGGDSPGQERNREPITLEPGALC